MNINEYLIVSVRSSPTHFELMSYEHQ